MLTSSALNVMDPSIRIPLLLTGSTGGTEDQAALRRARLALYGSHTLATWGQRSWEFAVGKQCSSLLDLNPASNQKTHRSGADHYVLLNAGLLMLQLRPLSLALVSVFGLADSGAQVLAGAAVGSYLGRSGLRARCMSHDVMTADMPKEAAKSQAKQGVPADQGRHSYVCYAGSVGCAARRRCT